MTVRAIELTRVYSNTSEAPKYRLTIVIDGKQHRVYLSAEQFARFVVGEHLKFEKEDR